MNRAHSFRHIQIAAGRGGKQIMRLLKGMRAGVMLAGILSASGWAFVHAQTTGQAKPATKPAITTAIPKRMVPVFEYDETFPKPLPNHWITGTVVGIDVDAKQHVWIVHRAPTLRPDELH